MERGEVPDYWIAV